MDISNLQSLVIPSILTFGKCSIIAKHDLPPLLHSNVTLELLSTSVVADRGEETGRRQEADFHLLKNEIELFKWVSNAK